MAKVYGVEYPERPLMAVLSDLLGIAHFTTSNGSTVRRDFLEAVAARLGVNAPDTIPTKDGVLEACVEAASQQQMDPSLLSPGSTVTDRALQVIIDGVLQNWQLGPDGELTGRDAAPKQPELPTGDGALDTPLSVLEDLLDPDRLAGPVDRRLMAVAYREDQDGFRKAVLRAYRQGPYEACCVTGHGPPQVLQAAHIIGHAEGGVSTVSNGLCLRADLHTLMDRRLLAVHEIDLEVLVHPVLAPTPYAELQGQKIHVPSAVADRPAPAALLHRRQAAGL